MKRIIVDLTEFNTWSGHLTGVQRVVYGIAQALHEQEKDTTFIRFSEKHKLFESVTFEQFNLMTSELESVLSTENEARIDPQKLKQLAKRFYNKTPLWVRNRLTPARKEKLIRNAKRLYVTVKNLKIQQSTQLVKIDAQEFGFKKNDVIISAGRAWDSEAYMTALEGLRKTQSVKIAYVVYDLIPIYQQHTFGPGLTDRFSKYLYRALKDSDYLLPISESTRRDTLRFANEIGVFDLPTIKTIRLGDDISKPSKNPPTFVTNPAEFTICVGTIEARKNHIELYYAYKLAAERHITLPDLYIIGSPGWLTSDVIYFMKNDADVKDKITILHNVADQDLAWMYKNALFTVYPSQYEGWGLPVAESIAFGTPCITSTASSMPEIAPDYVDYVSPFDPAALLDKMVEYSDPDKSAKKRELIQSGHKLYTWNQSVRTITKLID